MATMHHQVWINAPISKVYGALATAEALGKWWAPHTSTQTPDGLVLAHDPGGEHGVVKQKVVDVTPDKRIEWEIISTHPKQSPAYGWMGTHIIFELSRRDNPGLWRGITDPVPQFTVLDFRHTGWDESSDFFGFCNFAWGCVLNMLKEWCEK
jgi:uncharacterized protein YndB with AHSA1/START domain